MIVTKCSTRRRAIFTLVSASTAVAAASQADVAALTAASAAAPAPAWRSACAWRAARMSASILAAAVSIRSSVARLTDAARQAIDSASARLASAAVCPDCGSSAAEIRSAWPGRPRRGRGACARRGSFLSRGGPFGGGGRCVVQEADHGFFRQRAQVRRVGPDMRGPQAAADPGTALSIFR